MFGDSGMSGAFQDGKSGATPPYGQGYTASETIAHFMGQNARAADQSGAGQQSVVGLVGPRLNPDTGVVSGKTRRSNSSRIFSVFGILGALYGANDSLTNHASIAQSASVAYGYTYALSDRVGQQIRNLGPDSQVVSVLNGARWVIGFAVALNVGFGAGLGSGAIWIGREGVQAISHNQ